MSIAQSILEIAVEEATRQKWDQILRIRITYGALAQIMPESLQFCFEHLINGTAHQGILLEMECLPLRLRCPACGHSFGGESQESLWQGCPACGNDIGHIVEQGRELLVSQIEGRKL